MKGKKRMKNRIKYYIDNLFEGAPLCRESVDLKEEILHNTLLRYDDAVSAGKGEDAAYEAAIAGIGDVNPLIDEIRAKEGATFAYEAVLDKSAEKSAEKGDGDDEDEKEKKPMPFAKKIGKRIIWGSAVPIYLIFSVLSGAWGTSWLIFICALLVDNGLDIVVDMLEERKRKNDA